MGLLARLHGIVHKLEAVIRQAQAGLSLSHRRQTAEAAVCDPNDQRAVINNNNVAQAEARRSAAFGTPVAAGPGVTEGARSPLRDLIDSHRKALSDLQARGAILLAAGHSCCCVVACRHSHRALKLMLLLVTQVTLRSAEKQFNVEGNAGGVMPAAQEQLLRSSVSSIRRRLMQSPLRSQQQGGESQLESPASSGDGDKLLLPPVTAEVGVSTADE